MLRSMYSGVSGLRSHQVFLDTVGNNIANVNTSGYKSSSVVFSDTLSQILTGAGAPTPLQGGTNPAQVGLGTQLAGIQTNFTQGAVQLTGRATDMAIQGDGFFITELGGQQMYTRAGSLSFDAAGNLVAPSGARIQGWNANLAGELNTNGPVEGLRIPIGQIIEPQTTTNVEIGGNLPAHDGTSTTPLEYVTSIDVVDAQGAPHAMTLTWTSTGNANEWTLAVGIDGHTPTPASSTVSFPPVPPSTAPGPASPGTIDIAPGGLFAGPITLDFGAGETNGLTQFASAESTMSALSQDGAEIGFLRSFAIDGSGIVSGLFSNGQRQNLGQVALATFNNPGGLERAGDTSFNATVNSGQPQIGAAGTGPLGTIAGGTVEMSNVDLAAEFTNMIAAQRGFQANSRVISASDEILQDLVNLKR